MKASPEHDGAVSLHPSTSSRDDLFEALALAQREGPELLIYAEKNPGIDHSGAFQWACEHTGDLVHRAAQTERTGGGPEWGFGAYVEKVIKLETWGRTLLPYSISYDTPRHQAARNLANRRHLTIEQVSALDADERRVFGFELLAFIGAMEKAGQRYAAAYEQLRAQHPPLTFLQERGIAAAIALGRMEWMGFVMILVEIHNAVVEAAVAAHTDRNANFNLYHRPVRSSP